MEESCPRSQSLGKGMDTEPRPPASQHRAQSLALSAPPAPLHPCWALPRLPGIQGWGLWPGSISLDLGGGDETIRRHLSRIGGGRQWGGLLRQNAFEEAQASTSVPSPFPELGLRKEGESKSVKWKRGFAKVSGSLCLQSPWEQRKIFESI